MNTTSSLTGDIQARKCLAIPDTLTLDCGLQASHAIMNDRSDDGHVERLCSELGSINDVVIELLAAACLAGWLIPRLARGVRWPRATIRVLSSLHGGLIMQLVSVDEGL